MVRPVFNRSIAAFRTPSTQVATAHKSALIGAATAEYNSDSSAITETAVLFSSEAPVNIHPTSSTGPAAPLSSPVTRPAASSPTVRPETSSPAGTKLTSPADEVTFSAEALEVLASESGDSSLRAERLAQIKAEIEAGTYDTEAKFDAAVERLLDEIV